MNIFQYAQPGELKTRIRIQTMELKRLPGSIAPVEVWVDIGNVLPEDPPKYKYCKWINAHGSDLLMADQQIATGAATLILRYDNRITPACRIIKGEDENNPYEIIGEPDNIQELGVWMAISVKRAVSG